MTLSSVILLSQGEIIYCGPRQDVVPYFAGLGYSCGQFVNPADFFLDLLSPMEGMKRGEHVSSIRMRLSQSANDCG